MKTIGLNIKYDKNQPLGEAYTCLQGEGKYMGIPHILLRVTGCRLRCQFANSFCDTPLNKLPTRLYFSLLIFDMILLYYLIFFKK